MSPCAGGVGLTLTAVNHVIHLSRWWNPAVEDQCTDRVFRIGQRRTVHVYLPLARHPVFGENCFDLRLHSLMNRKREMNRRVLAPASASDGDVRDLYRSTLTEPRREVRDASEFSDDFDLLEPTAFEKWVLEQLGKAGYDVQHTPRSHDRGADGLVTLRVTDETHTIIVQCKHTQQSGAKCRGDAIKEVLRSISSYNIVGDTRPIVVTNAVGFTREAVRIARRKGVLLVDRGSLSRLRAWRTT